jgi:hypothetical protein
VSKLNPFGEFSEESLLTLSLFRITYGGSYSIGSIVKSLLTINLVLTGSGSGIGDGG